MISRLAHGELDGKTVSTVLMRTLTAQIILGGISTSTNLLGSTLHRLLRDPALHARLRAESELMPAAVEQALRLDLPVLFVVRECTTNVEIAKEKIEAGEIELAPDFVFEGVPVFLEYGPERLDVRIAMRPSHDG